MGNLIRVLVMLPFVLTSLLAVAQKRLALEAEAVVRRVDSSAQSIWLPERCDSWWDKAVLHIGNLEAFGLTHDTLMLQYSISWAEHNRWMGARNTDKSRWQYKKPIKTHNHVLFADWQACFQVYADLFSLRGDSLMISRALEVMRYEMHRPCDDYWYWMDALFMAMPAMAKLRNITHDNAFSDKMHEYFVFFDRQFWDKDAHLYYRDSNYVYPKRWTWGNGGKDFWARGNGWVISAFARVMQELPESDPHYPHYKERYLAMADTIKNLQLEAGYWSNSLCDTLFSGGYESSGTSLYLYALCWGVNNKLLSRKEYAPVISKAWQFLIGECLQPDFTIGYCYDVEEYRMAKYEPDPKCHTSYGTGAFLMGASEYIKYLKAKR